MSGSACAGVEGIRPTTATRANPDRTVMKRFRPFCTSGRSPLHVVRLPGELTGSGTTFALPLLHAARITCLALQGIHPRLAASRSPLVPRLRAGEPAWTQRGDRADPTDPLPRPPERHTLVPGRGRDKTAVHFLPQADSTCGGSTGRTRRSG